jgi:hypothetical protein
MPRTPAFAGDDAIGVTNTKVKTHERLRKFTSLCIKGIDEGKAYCEAYGYEFDHADPKKLSAAVDKIKKLAYFQDQKKIAAAMVNSEMLEKHGIKAGEILGELKRIALNSEKDSDRISAGKVILAAIGADAPKQDQSTHLTINLVKFDGNYTHPLDRITSGITPPSGERHSAVQISATPVSDGLVAGAGQGSETDGAGQPPA